MSTSTEKHCGECGRILHNYRLIGQTMVCDICYAKIMYSNTAPSFNTLPPGDVFSEPQKCIQYDKVRDAIMRLVKRNENYLKVNDCYPNDYMNGYNKALADMLDIIENL